MSGSNTDLLKRLDTTGRSIANKVSREIRARVGKRGKRLTKEERELLEELRRNIPLKEEKVVEVVEPGQPTEEDIQILRDLKEKEQQRYLARKALLRK